MVDLLVAVHKVGSPKIVNLRSGDSTIKTDLEVFDHSSRSVNCTFWGIVQHLNTISERDIVLLRNVQVKEFMGRKSLGFTWNSRIEKYTNHIEGYEELKTFVTKYSLPASANLLNITPIALKISDIDLTNRHVKSIESVL